MPTWLDDAVLWHLYPLGFVGAETSVGEVPGDGADRPVQHRLDRLEAWLDYAADLGCSGLLLGPVFASGTHGYDTEDHFRIDPRLGDEADFDRLVAAARARGLRLVLDGVFNHVGRSFPVFAEAKRSGPHSPAGRWFRRTGGGPDDYATFEGHHQLVALDHTEPAVADHVTRVLTYWLDRGISGWRLDAAYAVPPAFWRTVLAPVRAAHPEAWFLAEVIHGDYAEFATESTVDSVTQYELWKAIWSSLNDRNLFELEWALRRHGEFAAAELPQTFVGNHDVTRLATRLDDQRHLGHALAVLMCVAGVPSIYAGDEQAFQGTKEEREGGDDAIRPEFPLTPAGLAPSGRPMYHLHRRLLAFRRRNPWLTHAHTTTEHVVNRGLALRSRPASGAAEGAAGTETLLLLNLDDEAYDFPVDATGFHLAETDRGGGSDRASAAAAATGRGEDTPITTVPAHGWSILLGD
ncbi:Glycosidase [Actinopolymorpha cephalotaxi]|uniref:Glycosidase n=1 Tax=Actinopolymorpha cephalotaxi TaxID=504797 RepID=A0A1I2ZJA7_9ACTN|nr:alpha-amylase family protein [Actinopolymorpha cephalotaxi]NYH81996.1 glycosidase [Actinopolymorpha cephalotaxi]SFH37211.1 Glycosidase [Actinopolymorpha cephalotaxi]